MDRDLLYVCMYHVRMRNGIELDLGTCMLVLFLVCLVSLQLYTAKPLQAVVQ